VDLILFGVGQIITAAIIKPSVGMHLIISGQSPTQEVVVKVSEQQYKRNSYLSGAILIFIGGMLSWGVIIKWKEP
jgi:hypothetical protein